MDVLTVPAKSKISSDSGVTNQGDLHRILHARPGSTFKPRRRDRQSLQGQKSANFATEEHVLSTVLASG